MDDRRLSGMWTGVALLAAAALGCLQPGIDPVFLSLLSRARDIPLASHGWIVGATQAGAALGSLIVWRMGARLPAFAPVIVAALAIVAMLAGLEVGGGTALIAARAVYGLAMGVIYTRAMALYAAHRPSSAYGAVFLTQLILSTLVSLVLPRLAEAFGDGAALTGLVLVPLAALVAGVVGRKARSPLVAVGAGTGIGAGEASVPPAGWALASATFWFICATMAVWSFSGALAVQAGINEAMIGEAVAAGSIVGALTAALVMRERAVVPLAITGVLAGACLIAPLLMTRPGAPLAFEAAIVLLNIGSTAIIIRCSGMATARSTNAHFRTFVACTHSLGMIAGPVGAAGLTMLFGASGLIGGAILAIAAGVGSVLFAALAERRREAQSAGEVMTEEPVWNPPVAA